MHLVRSLLIAVTAGALGAMLTGAISLAASPTHLTVEDQGPSRAVSEERAVFFARFMGDDVDARDEQDERDGKRRQGPRAKPAAADLDSVLDRLVAVGTITAAQKTAILEALKSERRPASPVKPARAALHQLSKGAVKAAMDYLGVPADEIARTHRDGKSLADLALAKGKTRDGLISAILGAVLKSDPNADQAKAREAIARAVDSKFVALGQAKPRPSASPKPSSTPAPSASASPSPAPTTSPAPTASR